MPKTDHTPDLTLARLIPQGSLLAWIDDIYEEPSHLGGRTLGTWLNVAAALDCRRNDHEQAADASCDPLFPPALLIAEGDAKSPHSTLHFVRFGACADGPLYHGDFANGVGGDGVPFHYWDPQVWRLGGPSGCMEKASH